MSNDFTKLDQLAAGRLSAAKSPEDIASFLDGVFKTVDGPAGAGFLIGPEPQLYTSVVAKGPTVQEAVSEAATVFSGIVETVRKIRDAQTENLDIYSLPFLVWRLRPVIVFNEHDGPPYWRFRARFAIPGLTLQDRFPPKPQRDGEIHITLRVLAGLDEPLVRTLSS